LVLFFLLAIGSPWEKFPFLLWVKVSIHSFFSLGGYIEGVTAQIVDTAFPFSFQRLFPGLP